MRNKTSIYFDMKNPRGPRKIDLPSSGEEVNGVFSPAFESVVMRGRATSQSFVVASRSEIVVAGSEIRSSWVGVGSDDSSLYMNLANIFLGKYARKEVILRVKVRL